LHGAKFQIALIPASTIMSHTSCAEFRPTVIIPSFTPFSRQYDPSFSIGSISFEEVFELIT